MRSTVPGTARAATGRAGEGGFPSAGRFGAAPGAASLECMSAASEHRQRVQLRATGIVQGVGFRPAAFRAALALGLAGFVRNDGGGVTIEVEGAPENVARFPEALRRALAPPARIECFASTPLPRTGDEAFRIVPSVASHAPAPAVPPDLAPCDACLAELRDPRDRRYRHPFVACTACGPRYSVLRALPYDRATTAMADFPLCAACAREYGDPADRRFHAEPIACPACGPRARFVEGDRSLVGDAAIAAAARALGEGGIVAVKGVGGYLLAVDAGNARAVDELRRRKRRPHKPLAVMARDLAHAERIARLDDAGRAALLSPARPIVVAPLREGAPLAPGIAPGLRDVGVFLAPSPLQQLLADDGPPLLVMTSGNASDEPIAVADDDARMRLAPIAGAFLLHDREIRRRVDDSVVRAIAGAAVPLRRARGFVPESLPLPAAAPPLLAVGGGAKSTVCLAQGGTAWLSAHLGDLAHPDVRAAFRAAIDELQAHAGVRPVAVAHDLHPDLPSTHWAQRSGLRRIPVQHHHAHFAACLAEHGRDEPALGVIFDGTGYGSDGTAWGGEFLVGRIGGVVRAAHLAPLLLAGGEAAIRAPWRLGLAALHAAGEPLDAIDGPSAREHDAVSRLLRCGTACVPSTGAGRWFDAVAALCGLCTTATFDGQAAMLLEAAADPGELPPLPFELRGGEQVDLRPAIRAIATARRRGVRAGVVAARFHETLAHAVATCCARLRDDGAPRLAVLSGGCFQNRRFAERTAELLAARGFEVLQHRRVPPNDGGLALGQAAVAAHLLAREG